MASRSERAQNSNGDRSTVRLIRDIASDTSTLVKQELQLFKQEMTEALSARLKAVAAFAAAGVIALFVIGFMGMSAAAALSNVIAPWAANLIVAGGFLLLALAAVLFAKRRLKVPPIAPEETVRTVKEDVEWARAQLKR
ncbi:MAG: phage holin family protein [Actinomycetota bacterium]